MADISSESEVSAQSILVKYVDVGSSSVTINGTDIQCVNVTLGVLEYSGIYIFCVVIGLAISTRLLFIVSINGCLLISLCLLVRNRL